ncbi:SusD/RagB family nutrient-binding outer membrane lipoprotein [Rhabdobacter roseus]|uniref:SusD/RagB family nutrient-binding outer membrane lipoprotein n=1 Tax=Rhabdobacter roseus TaxID=1655419 RepID=A0A840TT24_9BACT|nr:SusD/RagB family nutrient-binding outer membrane lipoprotein [Rhabdobacter roseus]MBB5287546.1 hypothetical protein [Rhabdobacter roseus]
MKSVLKFIIAITGVLSFSACDQFLDVNENPNAPGATTLPLSAKFPSALVATVNLEVGLHNQVGAFWGGYWGTTNEGVGLYIDLKTYNGPEIRHQRDGIHIWENNYNTLLYYQLIREEAQEKGALFYLGAAKIMQGWHFLRLVDVYNGVPFDDALQGTKVLSPRYEDGKTVYEKAINLITEGIVDMKSTLPGTEASTDDILFKGDKTLWAKFGNTVKLRALVRQSQVAGQASYITSEIQKIQQEGSGYLGVGQSALAQPGYLNTAGKLNPLWETYYRNVQGVSTNAREDIRPTNFLLGKYQERNDPRLANLYVAVNGEYKGVIFGNQGTAPAYARAATSLFKGPNENSSRPAALFKSAQQASVLLGSFESLFLQAEAAQRGWLPGSAQTFYEQGIQESFKYMEVPAAEFAAYNAQALVNFEQAPNKIERILEQKWLALNSLNSLEAWSEFRRTGFPDIPVSPSAPTPTARPLRFMYPESELMTNGEQARKMGGDDTLKDAVWWDR